MTQTPCEANSVIACIDGSEHTKVVLDASLWCAKQLQAPIGLLHAHDKHDKDNPHDYSGNLGFDTKNNLLEELANADAEKNAVLLAHGKFLLKESKLYLQEKCDQGIFHPTVYKLHRHEVLKKSIKNLPDNVQMIVLGQKGTDEHASNDHIGHQLESAIRSAHCPVLVVTERFSIPKTALYAFDNREHAKQGLKWIATHPMFTKTHIHMVYVADDNDQNKEDLRYAASKLKQNGNKVNCTLLDGNVTTSLVDYQKEHDLDMVIMGAYGHSRLYEMFKGSNTHHMLEKNLKSIFFMRF